MTAALRLALVWATVTAIAGLQSCAGSPTASPQPVAAAVRSLSIGPAARGAGLAFVVCADCPSPTPKTLGAAESVRSIVTTSAAPPELAPAAPPAPAPAPAPELPASPIKTEHFTLTFELGRAELSRQARQQLDALVPLAQSAVRVRIVGFTDDLGTRELNARLSSARALNTMLRLRDALVEPYPALTASGRPHCCYLTDNRGEAQRAPNRRVEVDVDLLDSPKALRLVLAARSAGTASKAKDPSRRKPGAGHAGTAGKAAPQAPGTES